VENKLYQEFIAALKKEQTIVRKEIKNAANDEDLSRLQGIEFGLQSAITVVAQLALA
jgi:hypothetical protein